MAWVPSHQELREHPKTRRAARKAGVSLPTMIGHLHLLWYWALDHAADGDVSRYDAEDLAEAALWEGDAEAFLKALIDCGPGGGPGFIDPDGKLNDWAEYGGKYAKRVADGKKAAAKRWGSDQGSDANPDGEPMGTHKGANAEERRGEENTLGDKPRVRRATGVPDEFPITDHLMAWVREKGIEVDVRSETDKFLDHHRAKGSKFKDWDAAWRKWMRQAHDWAARAGGTSRPVKVVER